MKESVQSTLAQMTEQQISDGLSKIPLSTDRVGKAFVTSPSKRKKGTNNI